MKVFDIEILDLDQPVDNQGPFSNLFSSEEKGLEWLKTQTHLWYDEVPDLSQVTSIDVLSTMMVDSWYDIDENDPDDREELERSGDHGPFQVSGRWRTVDEN